ncbi:MAG TPA: ABC transporter permease [Acidimicrobiales bacterium]|nr:ABC transporter permease [Acidimicrobiales bacterium]
MLSITLHDLQYRSRQFIIAVAGAGLVFAMTLLLAGLAAGFGSEINNTVAGIGGSSWIVSSGSSGRIAALSPLPASALIAVDGAPGVHQAAPVVIAPQAANVGAITKSVVLVGYVPGVLGSPAVNTGRVVRQPGEAVVDTSLGVGIGQSFEVSGRQFTVVGTVSGDSLLGGVADAWVSLGDAQTVAFGGRSLISAVIVNHPPADLPPGLKVLSSSQIASSSLSAMSAGVSSIQNSRTFMWIIAAVIVAALVYVSALERTRDFAVLKALGSTSRSLFFGLATQAVLVALIAAALAAAVANFMKGLFAQPVDIPGNAFVILPLSAVVVGMLASLVALRRAIAVDPAAAFAGG